MEKVSTLGLMEGNMKVNTKMIRNMDSGHITGQTVKHMKVNGSTENSMVKQDSQTQKEEVSQVYGKMENVLNGQMRRAQCAPEVKNPKMLLRVVRAV